MYALVSWSVLVISVVISLRRWLKAAVILVVVVLVVDLFCKLACLGILESDRVLVVVDSLDDWHFLCVGTWQ